MQLQGAVRAIATTVEAIRAMAKHHRSFSPFPPKSPIVDALAHLSIELLGRMP